MNQRPDEKPRRPDGPVFERIIGRPRIQRPSNRTSGPGSSGARVGRAMLLAGIGLALVACAALWDSGSAEPGPTASVPAVPVAADLAPSLEIPEPVNERVDRWIQHYLTDDPVTFEQFLSREGTYGEMIREKLRARGMPEDLLYMAMIESGFSARATSQVEASGLWQFMGPTAREYGLVIGEYVDERRDPIRATDAALDYLERLHERFGSWYLAAAAYNAGPNRVARAVRSAGDRPNADHELFWEIIDQLPSETREYVPRMLAAVLLAKEAEAYGFDVERTNPYEFEHVWVPGGTSLQMIAQAVDLPVGELRTLNPHLVRDRTPPGTSFGVRVPPGRAPQVVASLGNDWGSGLADD